MTSNFSRNLTMLTDFYEITMANGYFNEDKKEIIAAFDLFFRTVPDKGGYAIMAGLEQAIQYIQELEFTDDDIDYLRNTKLFNEQFLNYLAEFKFSCDVYAVAEGTPIFPGEPILTVKGPVIQAQFVETLLLICINHQSLITTKANRICRAANGKPVMEFGARRAQGFDAAVYGARAAYIGGCTSTSNVLAARMFDIPPAGTMAHSWIQMFDSELEAFKAYARNYPDGCVLLVDTYNTLKSGIPNAIRTFNEVLAPMGKRPVGIRIDSGDITYLTKKARKMLDEAGYPDCKIVASNSLDEYIIRDMLMQGAFVDSFGVGERQITSSTSPVFGGVYKLAAVWDKDGNVTPKIKISENVAKITNPGFKQTWRLFDNSTGKAIADLISLFDEEIDSSEPYELFDPNHTWKRKVVTDFTAVKLLEPVFINGEFVGKLRSATEIKNFCKEQVDLLWDEVKRFENPHSYYVDYSQKLWDLKHELLAMHNK